MKRQWFLITTLFLLFAVISVAQAKNGPHTGPVFANNTDACSACHRSHTSTTAPLLGNEANSMYNFCTFCHDGTGANTNVVSGIFEGDTNIVYKDAAGNDHNSVNDGQAGRGLNGGGFQGAFYYTGRSGRNSDYQGLGANGDAKRHNVTGNDTNSFTAWGGGNNGPGQEITGFTCISCHDPHGTENTDGSERYRILRGGVGMMTDSTVNGVSTGPIKTNEVAAFGGKDYTRDAYRTGIAEFCVACHTQYKTAKGTTDQFGNNDETDGYDAGDGNGSIVRHRHKLVLLGALGDINGIRGQGVSVWDNMNTKTLRLPVIQSNYSLNIRPTDSITCLTCHQTHGTRSNMSSSATTHPANSSTLLRLDNRGVCEACHYK